MGKFGKLLFLFFISYIHDSFSMEESLSDLYELLENPKLFAKFEKRLALLAQSADPADVDCYETIGTLNEDCRFHSNGSTIIKTKESLARGASFLEEFANVSCPTECTRLCCDKPACDTAVYQDKNDHKCYLFQCGEVGTCVFAEHDSYWTGWVSTINLHTDAQEPYVLSHENDLANVGSQSNNGDTPEVKETEPPTTPTPKIPTTTSRPGLGQYCESYETVCEDPHAECLMKSCKCRVGYHQKHGICRKHCRDEEFECENIVYGSESRQCVLNRYVCDGHSDCIDGSDELNCQQNNKYGGRRPDNNRFHDRPDNKDNFHLPHADVPHRRPSTSTVAAPNEATKSVSQEPGVGGPVPTDVENAIDTPDTQTSTDTDNPPSETDDNQAPTDTDLQQASADTDSDSPTADDNGSESKPQENIASQDSNGPVFHILNSDSGAAVETLPDSSQGPVVALSLGLAITMMLLIVVGCRLRTVKRRLRKGRALHSNEADYLINGMYL